MFPETFQRFLRSRRLSDVSGDFLTFPQTFLRFRRLSYVSEDFLTFSTFSKTFLRFRRFFFLISRRFVAVFDDFLPFPFQFLKCSKIRRDSHFLFNDFLFKNLGVALVVRWGGRLRPDICRASPDICRSIRGHGSTAVREPPRSWSCVR